VVPDEPAQPDRRSGTILFAAVVWAYVYFCQGGGWNQNARWDLVRALVEQQTFRINAYAGNTYDIAVVFDPTLQDPKAVYDEYRLFLDRGWLDQFHLPIYANKPPGLSWAAVPVYVPLYAVERLLGIDPASFWAANVNVHVMTAFVVALPSALLGVWMLIMLRRTTSMPHAWCVWIALCGSLGTLLWPYATGLYSHSVVAALLFRAWMAVETPSAADQTPRRALLIGLLLGAAVAVEYSAAPVVVLLAVRALICWTKRPLLLGWGLLGLAPWAMTLGLYHTCLFGNPWTTSYRFQRPHLYAGLPTDLFHVPDPRVWWALLVLPHRGLLVTSPILVLGIVGSVVGLTKRNWLPLAVFLYYLLLISCWAEWKGGSALGPRYLVPAVPFLVVATGAVWCRASKWSAVVLGAASIAIMLIGTSVRVEVPDRQEMPPIVYVLNRFFTRNNVSTNPQHVTEISARPRPDQPAHWPRRFASYNLGELMGLHGRASLIPLLAGWLILACTPPVLRRVRRLRRAPHA